jgi:hypothetical protein
MPRPIPSEEVCHRCGEKAERRERDTIGIWTGKYVCMSHYKSDYYMDIVKNDPNSQDNIIKALAGSRTGDLDLNSNTGKGKKFEKLSSIYFGVDNLNVKNDNYCWPIDHSRHPILGTLQTQGRFFYTYIGTYGGWLFDDLDREWSKKFGHMILWCASKNGKRIERGYIIPKNEIYDPETDLGRRSITIVKNPSKGVQWHEQYRIKDPEELKKINDIWQKIVNGQEK